MKISVADMIKEDSVEIEIIKEVDGYWDGPDWIDGQKKHYLIQASPFYLSSEEIKEYEAGKYTTQDLALDVAQNYEMLNKDNGQAEEVELEKEDIILFDDKRFKFDEKNSFTVHGDYYEFMAKKVSEDES